MVRAICRLETETDSRQRLLGLLQVFIARKGLSGFKELSPRTLTSSSFTLCCKVLHYIA